MNNTLVTVICLCYNHEDYISAAVRSVLDQTYTSVELIIVDDFSQDGSRRIIEGLAKDHPEIKTIMLNRSNGNCAAFNKGLAEARGEYIIDLSADDVLLPDRILEGIKCFNSYGAEYGINFTDAEYVTEEGIPIKTHYQRDKSGNLKQKIPEGIVYPELLSRYFICTPTMMIRKAVFDQIGGYDEALSYEDFDFWIRTGKLFKYCYTDKVLVRKRLVKNALSSRQYIRNSEILRSTCEVCLKAEKINETEDDRKALLKRASYEFRKAIFSGNPEIAKDFAAIIKRNTKYPLIRSLYSLLNSLL